MKGWKQIVICLTMACLLASVWCATDAKTKKEAEKPVAAAKEPEAKMENATELDPKAKRLLACSILQIAKDEQDREELKKLKGANKNETKLRRNKIKALRLTQCLKDITDSIITKVILTHPSFSSSQLVPCRSLKPNPLTRLNLHMNLSSILTIKP